MNLEGLPDDVLLEVFACLRDPYEVVQCCAASRRLQHIGKNQYLWHDFARRKYAHPQQRLYRSDWWHLFQERNGFGNPLLAQRVYPSPHQTCDLDEEEHEIAAVAAQGDAVLVAQGSKVHLLQLQPPSVTHPAEAPPPPPPLPPPPSSSSAAAAAAPSSSSPPSSKAQCLCASANFGSAVPTALCILQGCDQQHGMPSSLHVAVGTLQGGLHLLIFEKLTQHQSNDKAFSTTYTCHIEPLVSATGVRLQGGSIPVSQACTTTDSTLAALHDNFLSSSLDLPPSFVEFVDVSAQRRTGMTRDVMDSWALVTINCLAGSARPSSDALNSVDPHILLAGSVSTPCSLCWEAFMPWLCGHKRHAALAALSILDTRLPGYVAERFTLQHRSLYPHLASARGSRPHVFTSHADCPLCVWDLRRMSVPIFASNSRNLDHQTEGPLGRAENPAPNQAMFLDASEDILLGRALNGTLWIWDLAELLGWQDGSGGLGVWEALEYLSPWESHSLPPKAWPLCLGALQPGANILPVSCLIKGSDPTSLLVVTDPRTSSDALPNAEGCRVMSEEREEPQRTSSEAEERLVSEEREEPPEHHTQREKLSYAAGQGKGGGAQGMSGGGGCGEWWEEGTYYSGAWGVSLECWHCGQVGHFMRSCPLLRAELAEERTGECAEHAVHAGECAEERTEHAQHAERAEHVEQAEHAGHAECTEEHAERGKAGLEFRSLGGQEYTSLQAQQAVASQERGVSVREAAHWQGAGQAGPCSEDAVLCNEGAVQGSCGQAVANEQTLGRLQGSAQRSGAGEDSEVLLQRGREQCCVASSAAGEASDTEGTPRVGATPALCAGGVGEQLVRISLCRR